MLGVLPREDVIRHDERPTAHRQQSRDKRLDESGLSGADGPADADTRDAGRPNAAGELILEKGVVVRMIVKV
jgi:hypothetical protein